MQPSLGGSMHIPSLASYLQQLAYAILLLAAIAVGEAAGQSSAPPAAPDETAAARAKELDALFAALKSTKVEEEADTMVAEIWRLWLQSGNAEVDGQMQRAVLLMGSMPAMALPILDGIVARLPDWAEGWNKRATVLYLIGEYDRSLTVTECWRWNPGTSVRSQALASSAPRRTSRARRSPPSARRWRSTHSSRSASTSFQSWSASSASVPFERQCPRSSQGKEPHSPWRAMARPFSARGSHNRPSAAG
jgi:hypothetical protein